MELNLSGLDGQVNFASTLGRVMVDGGLKKLAHCNISRNSIGRQGCEKLMEGILSKQVPQLSHLDLSVCTLTDNGLNAICKRRALFLSKKAPVVLYYIYINTYMVAVCVLFIHNPSHQLVLLCQLCAPPGLAMRQEAFERIVYLNVSANIILTSLVHLATVLKLNVCKKLRTLDISKNTPPGERRGLPYIFKEKWFEENRHLKIIGD